MKRRLENDPAAPLRRMPGRRFSSCVTAMSKRTAAMITTAHKIYAGPGAPHPALAGRSGLRMEGARPHSFAPPQGWASDRFTSDPARRPRADRRRRKGASGFLWSMLSALLAPGGRRAADLESAAGARHPDPGPDRVLHRRRRPDDRARPSGGSGSTPGRRGRTTVSPRPSDGSPTACRRTCGATRCGMSRA